MPRRVPPPRFHPNRPMTIAETTALNRAMEDLYRLVGGFVAGNGLAVQDDSAGVRYGVIPSALQSLLCSLTVQGQDGVVIPNVDAILFGGQNVELVGADACGNNILVTPPTPIIPDSPGPPVPPGGGGDGPSTPPPPGGPYQFLSGCNTLWIWSQSCQCWLGFAASQLVCAGSGSGSSNPCLTYDCANCTAGASLEFEIELTGVTANSCSDPAALNKLFSLQHAAGTCLWQSPMFLVCSGTISAFWQLAVGPAFQELQLVTNMGAVLALYAVKNYSSSWDCNSVRTLALQGPGSSNYHWPATITLIPTCHPGSGSSGSGGNAGTIPTTCCPGDLMTVSWSGTVSGRTGAFTNLPTSLTFIHDPTAPIPTWTATMSGGLGCVGVVVTIVCDPVNGWTLGTSGQFCVLAGVVAGTAHCPSAVGGFELIFSVPSGAYGCGTGGWTLTVLSS